MNKTLTLQDVLPAFENSNSNRLIHNTRTYIDELSPKLDSFISKNQLFPY